MPKRAQHRDLLVLRPWLSSCFQQETYGHVDAIVMRHRHLGVPDRYGDLDVLYQDDCDRKPLSLEGFRFQCQVDERNPEAYAWTWGYRSCRLDIFSARDLERYGASIRRIEQAMTRLQQEDGAAETVGRYVVRLARILRVDGIALLATSPNGSFGHGLRILHQATAPVYGDVTGWIDVLVQDLHAACRRQRGLLVA